MVGVFGEWRELAEDRGRWRSIVTDLEAIYTQTDSSPRSLVISISMCL